jgi:hypothetical protein
VAPLDGGDVAAVCGRAPGQRGDHRLLVLVCGAGLRPGQAGRAAVLLWDNASWHESQIVRRWLHAHNRQVKQTGQGVRLIVCFLPVKSPWLNPIEPKWLAGKRRVAEPDRLLGAGELAERVCATYGCPHHPHLVAPPSAQPKKATAKKAA